MHTRLPARSASVQASGAFQWWTTRPPAASAAARRARRCSDTFATTDSREYRAKLLTRLEVANDPRVERYWQLISTINDWPTAPSLAPIFDWFIQALQHHPNP